jgi:exonuclease III/sulfur relay (sulfurtransferase) DsrC/TusE family protein
MPAQNQIRIAAFNARGLRDFANMMALSREMKRRNIDVMLIQEHNIKKESVLQMTSHLNRVEIFSAWSCSASNEERGGAAIWMRNRAASPPQVVIDHKRGDSLDGGLCMIEAHIGSDPVRIASVYVTVHAPDRKEFIKNLSNHPLINNDTIIGGDMNCVANPALDFKSLDGAKECDKQNTGGPELEKMMTEKGLTDVYRLFNKDKREYTRFGSSVYKRLDRIYVKEYNSELRWVEAAPSFDFFRQTNARSDHYAMICTAEWGNPAEITPTRKSIDTKVLFREEVRKFIPKLLTSCYTQYPPETYGQSKPFETFKTLAFKYLHNETMQFKKPSEIKLLENEIKWQYEKAQLFPRPDSMTKIIKLEQKLIDARMKKRKDLWFAFDRAAQAEMSTKKFHKQFRNRLSTHEITSLHITPSWNLPQLKEGVANSNETILRELTKYYKWLFQAKPSFNADRLLKLLSDDPIPPKQAKASEKAITLPEVERAIDKLAQGKSPGPDGLPAEFYIQFRDLLAPKLKDLYEEALELGNLEGSIRQGEIIVLYKKGDPREVRNYRPITLLNLDYKIYSRIVVARLKPLMDSLVSEAQLGFVPGRRGAESTHLLKLIQATLDEEDSEGLIIALDWEKAFDRVSWDYLHKAVTAVGMGETLSNMIKIMYNKSHPPSRHIRANGRTGESFEIFSGVPQGCPASPLIFLIVAEALTRAIERDDKIKGILIDGQEYKITQFADDTQLLLRGYACLRRVFITLHEYEDATAMKANTTKFEGLRCGSLKKKPVPNIPELFTDVIRWVPPGECMKILGIPFWEEYDVDKFWDMLYGKMKSCLASWRNLDWLTICGRNLLASSMIMGRFRYHVQTLECPEWLNKAIESDCKALIWAREPEFNKEEDGTDIQIRRFCGDAENAPRKTGLGGGVLDWRSHLKGLQGVWILYYLDASKGRYKLLLDRWFDRENEGRGIVLSSCKRESLISSANYSLSKLPKFWKDALKAIRELELNPIENPSEDGIRSQPVWNNPALNIPRFKLEREWRNKMHLYTLKDFINPETGRIYSREAIIEYVKNTYKIEGEYAKINNKEYVKITKFVDEFHKMFQCVPIHWRKTLHKMSQWTGNYSAQARNMMSLMGATPSKGLGPELQGIVNPVQPVSNYSSNLEGLGYSNKPKVKIKVEKFRAVVMQNQIVYGLIENNSFHVHKLNTKGSPVPTHNYIATHDSELRSVLRWGGKIVGVAESYFPHPKEWRLQYIEKDLDKVTVKDLTRAFVERKIKPATCKEYWTKKLGDLPFYEIGKRYTTGVLTPKDFGSHYKCILHRTFRVRKHDTTAPNQRCRICDVEDESVAHWGVCPGLRPIFSALRVLDKGREWDQAPLNLLGVTAEGGVVPAGISVIHMCVWKELIIEIMKDKFNPRAVLCRGAARIKDRLDAFTRTKKNESMTLNAKGKKFDTKSIHRKLEGITIVDEDGDVMMDPLVMRWLDSFTSKPPHSGSK